MPKVITLLRADFSRGYLYRWRRTCGFRKSYLKGYDYHRLPDPSDRRRLFTNQYDVTSNRISSSIPRMSSLCLSMLIEIVPFASQFPRTKPCTYYMKIHITWNAVMQNIECLDDRNSTVTDGVLGHVRGIHYGTDIFKHKIMKQNNLMVRGGRTYSMSRVGCMKR